jgi:carbonic anhydrase
MKDGHRAPQAVILCCFDPRLHGDEETKSIFKEALAKKDIHYYVPLILAGGAKNLSDPKKEAYRETVIDNIETTINLHGTKIVILCNHIDCGGYGYSTRFKSLEEEKQFHQNELKKAAEVVKKRFPEMEVKTIILFLK